MMGVDDDKARTPNGARADKTEDDASAEAEG